MDKSVKRLITEELPAVEDVNATLSTITNKYSDAKSFPFLNENGARSKLWQRLFDILGNNDLNDAHLNCLNVIRILSRERTDLDNIITDEEVLLLLQKAGLKSEYDFTDERKRASTSEALKCMCNLIYNSMVAATRFNKNNCLEEIVKRLDLFISEDFPDDVTLFTLRVMFLITAVCEETRPKIANTIRGFTKLLQYFHKSNLTVSRVNVLCEILKVLFNATVSLDNEEDLHYKELVIVLRRLLSADITDKNKKMELQNNVINLLTNLPENLLGCLTEEDPAAKINFRNYDMEAPNDLLQILKYKLENKADINDQEHILSPVLSVLVKCARNERILRKFFRSEVLPPLVDVHKAPEEGTEMRNYLCRLLTTPVTSVRDLAADFLFVLCKENVGRMIKYTGYGNAAGLFAQRGLLNGSDTKSEESAYSSDSGDSDTEEYAKHAHSINPVTGRHEQVHPDPTADMTEEQKEYEAIKLLRLIDELSSKGVIQPCRIGKDGKPEPLEHILQLQEELPNQQVKKA